MKSSAANCMGGITAALVFLFTLTAVVPAEAKQLSLKSKLRESGISLKIIRLDRKDGFTFGIAFTGPNKTILLGPSPGGRCLILENGSEVVLQRDAATGALHIIQADGDIVYLLCVVQAVVTFFSDLALCEDDASCMFTSVITLITNVINCSSSETTTSTTQESTSTSSSTTTTTIASVTTTTTT